jgi:azurin
MRRTSKVVQGSIVVLCGAWLAAGQAFGKTSPLSIEGNDAMQYSTKELTVAADCTEVELTLKHAGKLPKSAMGHNWILTAEKDMQAVVTAGMQAGVANDYQPKGDKRIIAATKLVGGGESAKTTFKVADLKKGESYKYFCSFPGHSGMMNGTLVVK